MLGSIPFAYVVGRLTKGIDIRLVGTRNMGGMNTIRQIGLLPGVAVLALDIGKGSLAIVISRWLGESIVVVFLAGLVVVAGHVWPVFLRFKGGQGAATTVGVLFALATREFVFSFVIIVALIIFTRNTGFAMGAGIVLLPPLLWAFGEDWTLILYSVILPLFLVFINIPMFKRDITRSRSLKEYVFPKRPPLWQRKER